MVYILHGIDRTYIACTHTVHAYPCAHLYVCALSLFPAPCFLSLSSRPLSYPCGTAWTGHCSAAPSICSISLQVCTALRSRAGSRAGPRLRAFFERWIPVIDCNLVGRAASARRPPRELWVGFPWTSYPPQTRLSAIGFFPPNPISHCSITLAYLGPTGSPVAPSCAGSIRVVGFPCGFLAIVIRVFLGCVLGTPVSTLVAER